LKILVTGGCGFIGSHIVDRLIMHGFETAAADDLSSGSLKYLAVHNGKAAFYQCSILSTEFENAVKHFQPDAVIHLAAQVSVSRSVQDMVHDAEINIMGSVRLIELAKKYGIKKIIYSSSAAVYGSPQFLPVTTDHPLNPMSPYGISKMIVEKYLTAAQSLFGIEYMVLRFGNVYGPRQNSQGEGGVISIFINRMMKDSNPVIFGDGMNTRDFIFAGDVAEANLSALNASSSGIVNISSGVETSINELVTRLQQLMNKKIQPVHTMPRGEDIRFSVLCNKEALTALNWKPSVSLDDGLKQTIAFYAQDTPY
jgi:UDP-glucose 4-epimerase